MTNLMKKRIVITGASGMIGASLAKCACDESIEVLCLLRKNSNRLGRMPQSDFVTVKYCNINEYNDLKLEESYDTFYHLAWEKTYGISRDDVVSQVKNIQYTLEAVRLAKRLECKKFIGVGSQAEYGIVTEPLKSETPVNPESGYGIAKYAAGKLSRLLCSQLDLQFNWVRLLSVFGPLDEAHTLIMHAIHELQVGCSPEFTKCEQIWDYLYCDDAARALLAIGENGIDGKTYPLGSGNHQKLSGYLEIVKKVVAPGLDLHFGKREYYPHQPMYLCASIEELINDTGWKPKVSFEEGIRMIVTPPVFF